MKHFTWGHAKDLTEYYFVEPISDAGEWYTECSLAFDAKRTDNNDKIVDTIVQLLDCFVDLNYKESDKI
jgi:hypothetical protein